MLERFKLNLKNLKERLGSGISYTKVPEKGIEFEFVFGGEYSIEEWELTLNDLKRNRPNSFQALSKIVKDANSRTQDERSKLIDAYTFSYNEFMITRNAKEVAENKQKFEQF